MNSADTVISAARPASRWKLWITGFLLLGAAGAAYWKWGAKAPAPPERQRFFARGQAVPVRVTPAATGVIEVEIKALGTVTPLNTVTVRSRLDGELMRVLFSEGQSVGAGQLLAEIDPRPFQTQLNQVLGQQQENEARLKSAEGDLERYQKLVAEGLITKQQVTTQEALVQQYRGALQANEAQVANARLQLAYTQDHRAHQRTAGAAPGGRGQPDSRRRRKRPGRHHADAAHLGDLHRARGRAAGRARRLSRRQEPPGRGLGSLGGGDAGDRHAADRRQPDRHDDRDDQAARAVRQQRREAVSEPVREHAPARADAAERHGHPGGGRAARLLRHLRLRRQARQHRDDPAHRTGSRPGRARLDRQGAHGRRTGGARGRRRPHRGRQDRGHPRGRRAQASWRGCSR